MQTIRKLKHDLAFDAVAEVSCPLKDSDLSFKLRGLRRAEAQ